MFFPTMLSVCGSISSPPASLPITVVPQPTSEHFKTKLQFLLFLPPVRFIHPPNTVTRYAQARAPIFRSLCRTADSNSNPDVRGMLRSDGLRQEFSFPIAGGRQSHLSRSPYHRFRLGACEPVGDFVLPSGNWCLWDELITNL